MCFLGYHLLSLHNYIDIIDTIIGDLYCSREAVFLPNVRPVPGSGAAYLYFPGETEGRVKLSVTKEFGNMVEDRYVVYYKPKDKREVVLCTETEQHCEKLLPAGQGRIRIEGFYDPSKKLPISRAKFNGACSATGKQCNVNLRTDGTESLRITTGCNGSDYSVVELGGKDAVALCVGMGVSDRNSYLLAAHKHIRAKQIKFEEEDLGAKSANDGKANTKVLLDNLPATLRVRNDSAAYYCHSLKLGEKNTRFVEWYVPAIDELDLALSGWSNKDQSFIVPRDSEGYFSSTESGKRDIKYIRWSGSKNSNAARYTNAKSILCMYSVAM